MFPAKRLCATSMALMLAGCPSFTTPPAEGCRPVYSDAETPRTIRAAYLHSAVGTEIYRLDRDGIYAEPVGEIERITEFRSLMSKALQANAADRRFAGLRNMSDVDTADLDDSQVASTLLPLVSDISLAIETTPISVTTTLASIELMLDDLMNRMNSTVSSALFAMRGHVAATAADLNVMFRDRMQEAYDNLNEAERTALDRAQLIAAQAMASLEKLQKEGFAAASDAICQTTASFANYPNTVVGLGLPLERCFAPDVLCLTGSHNIRDTGSAHSEQLLQFRGVNLLPNGEYPDASLLVAGQETELPTAGGKSVLQVPLPGGLNGQPEDLSLRGSLFTRMEFDWPRSNVKRRWFFELKPYLVRSLEIEIIPTIEGPVRSHKDQECGVKAEGGSLGSREETATCTITADSGKSIERCEEVRMISHANNAKIRNRLFTEGACQWEVWAKSKSFYGAGSWIHFLARAHQIKKQRIPGRPLILTKTLNQNELSAVFTYPPDYVPAEYKIITGRYSYSVRITDNEGNSAIFTEANPTNPFGSAIMQGHRLTVTLNSPSFANNAQ